MVGPRIITEETKKEMKKVLKEIQDGTFARNWLLENRAAGRANFMMQRQLHSEHQIEKVGFFDEKSINGRALVVTLANPQSITVTTSS